MQSAMNNTLSILAERGYRITQSRKEVIALLAESSKPLTIQELSTAAASNEASVYRTLSLLLSEGLAESLQRRREVRYALASGHHHHLICTECGYTLHLQCTGAPPRPGAHSDFARIEDHEVTFYGVCTACT